MSRAGRELRRISATLVVPSIISFMPPGLLNVVKSADILSRPVFWPASILQP